MNDERSADQLLHDRRVAWRMQNLDVPFDEAEASMLTHPKHLTTGEAVLELEHHLRCMVAPLVPPLWQRITGR